MDQHTLQIQPDRVVTRGDYHEKWAHMELAHLILSTKDFVVGIDKNGKIDWETSVEYDDRVLENDAKHRSLLGRASLLEETPSEYLQAGAQFSFKRLIGEAIALSLQHDYSNAAKMLEAAANFFRDRSEEVSRRWYLSASALMALPFMLLGLVVWTLRQYIVPFEGVISFWLLFATVAGSMGALLSVIGRSGKLRFDCSSGRSLHYLEGASRIWAGALSGFVVGLAVRFGIILAPLSHGGSVHGVMLLAAFAAGAGERLVTSIISEFDSTQVVALTENNHQNAKREKSI